MRYAIPLLGDRVAPRCTFADSILLVTLKRGRILERSNSPMDGTTWADLALVLSDQRIDKMVCGGISRTTRDSIRACGVEVIENVAGESEEILKALQNGVLHDGYGLSPRDEPPGPRFASDDRTPRALGRRQLRVDAVVGKPHRVVSRVRLFLVVGEPGPESRIGIVPRAWIKPQRAYRRH